MNTDKTNAFRNSQEHILPKNLNEVEFNKRSVQKPAEGGHPRVPTLELVFEKPQPGYSFIGCKLVEVPEDHELWGKKDEGLNFSNGFQSGLQLMIEFLVGNWLPYEKLSPLGSPRAKASMEYVSLKPVLAQRMNGQTYVANSVQQDPLRQKDLADSRVMSARFVEFAKKYYRSLNQAYPVPPEGDCSINANLGGVFVYSQASAVVKNVIARQKSLLGPKHWNYFERNVLEGEKNEARKASKDFTNVIVSPIFVGVDKKVIKFNIHHSSGFLNYNSNISGIFRTLTNCLLPLAREIDLVIDNMIRSRQDSESFHSDSKIEKLKMQLGTFLSSISVMILDGKIKPLPIGLNAYNLFDMLLLYHNFFKGYLKVCKPDKHVLECILVKRMVSATDLALAKLYLFAKEVFEYEKNLLSKEVADKVVFPGKVEDEWRIPELVQLDKLKKPAPKSPKIGETAVINKDEKGVSSKKEEKEKDEVMPVELAPSSTSGKKKGGKAMPQESKKERTLREIATEKEKEDQKVEQENARRLGRANVLTAGEMEVVLKKLNDKWQGDFKFLFGNFKESNLKLTPQKVEALAKQFNEVIIRVFPGDDKKEKLAKDLLRDVQTHEHPPHSPDTGDKLPHNFLVIVRQYFLQRGIFPREGWMPTSEEFGNFEIFLTALNSEDPGQEE